jgi:dienelactone hydrolase
MNRVRRDTLIVTAFLPWLSGWAAANELAADPYAILRKAYAEGNAALASNAYAPGAVYSEHYPGTAPVIRVGSAQIEDGFARLYAQLGAPSPNYPIDINFRFATRQIVNGGAADTGFYRLRVGLGTDAKSYYGSFATWVRDGRFVADSSGAATVEDFEGLPGAVAYAVDDEALAAAYYDRHTGTYTDDTCTVVITRSARRLFALDECTGNWRGLNRQSGLNWSAGTSLIDAKGDTPYRFDLTGEGSLVIGALPASTFRKQLLVRLEAVRFGTASELGGALYLPMAGTGKRPALVMLHGSGPQDRNGYASIIALMAQRLARAGVVVLTFDKRGVGESRGRWNSASLDDLASDAQQAMRYLATRREVDGSRIGLAGSSQAGWIAAKAIADGAKPAFTILVGAAGSALTVEEQNLYNTEALMRCARIAPSDIRLALNQQRAFFAARSDASKQAILATLSLRAQASPTLRDWLFPATIEPSAEPQWYNVLDTRFDPLPVWKRYDGKAFFLFGTLDDSTPTPVAVQRLKSVSAARVEVLRGAQHLGLAAKSLCDGLETRQRFHPSFFIVLERWAKEL